MGISKTKKALKSLKQRVKTTEDNLIFLRNKATDELYQETVKCKDEIKTLIQAYENQIELNKRQNIKIKNQRGMLKALLRKSGGDG